MKRTLALLLLAVMVISVAALFVSCEKEITCDLCGKTKKTTPHEIEIEGEKGTVCEECYKEWKQLEEELKKLGS